MLQQTQNLPTSHYSDPSASSQRQPATMVPSHIFITDLDLVRCSQAVVTRLLRFCVAWNVNSAVLCSLECEAKEEEVMGIDMLLVNEKGVLRFVGVIKSTFSDHEQSAQCIMVDLQGDRYRVEMTSQMS
ncbi:hypothetical protein F2Q70_00025041 [Brassica cretica]|uniref:Uncharacterized protein n=1 Tax=Brassica cretica TaxID=69181 RepID=A0A8S9LIG6_BRACR|nr:hypothetical protein F2Q70_00025041 [Brassica cretica]